MKQKRYWLRGLFIGIIFIPIAFVYFPSLLFGLVEMTDSVITPVIKYLSIDVSGTTDHGIAFVAFCIGFLEIMLLASFLGWLYGKIKNRQRGMTIK